MSEAKLTARQKHYLDILKDARESGQSIQAAAQAHGIPAARLYSARQVLKQKGVLEQSRRRAGFAAVPVGSACDQHVELRTQLANGQPLWLRVPASQLRSALEALGA